MFLALQISPIDTLSTCTVHWVTIGVILVFFLFLSIKSTYSISVFSPPPCLIKVILLGYSIYLCLLSYPCLHYRKKEVN